MGKVYAEIDQRLEDFIRAQHMFFVATAPSGADGHINVSPKGLDTFRIFDPRTVAYLDLTGSGIETVAHLRENGRIVIMFCAFEGPPRIVRLHGRGEVISPGAPDFATLLGNFRTFEGTRSVIRIALERISDSCGYGVPEYHFAGHRQQLIAWANRKGPSGLQQYQKDNNARSIDGLVGLEEKD